MPKADRQPTPKPLPQISDAEWEVMKVLWDEAEAATPNTGAPATPASASATEGLSATEIIARLTTEEREGGGGKDWAPQTVKTLLSRLVSKGAAAYTAHGKSYRYRAAVTRDEVTRAESESFLSRIFGSKTGVSLMLAHLVEQNNLSQEEIDACKALLDKAEKRP